MIINKIYFIYSKRDDLRGGEPYNLQIKCQNFKNKQLSRT